MKTLYKSMVDYVKKYSDSLYKNKISYEYYADMIFGYAQLISQKPELWMFVACGEDGKPLEEPKKENYTIEELENTEIGYDFLEYQEANDRVLFSGFEVEPYFNDYIVHNESIDLRMTMDDFETIEDLIPYKLTLTKEI